MVEPSVFEGKVKMDRREQKPLLRSGQYLANGHSFITRSVLFRPCQVMDMA